MKKLVAITALLFASTTMACPQFNFNNLKCSFVIQDISYDYVVDRISNSAIGNEYLFSATFEGVTVDETIPSSITDDSGLTTITSCQGDNIIIEEIYNGISARQEMTVTGNGILSSGSQFTEVEDCDDSGVCNITFEKEAFSNNCTL